MFSSQHPPLSPAQTHVAHAPSPAGVSFTSNSNNNYLRSGYEDEDEDEGLAYTRERDRMLRTPPPPTSYQQSPQALAQATMQSVHNPYQQQQQQQQTQPQSMQNVGLGVGLPPSDGGQPQFGGGQRSPRQTSFRQPSLATPPQGLPHGPSPHLSSSPIQSPFGRPGSRGSTFTLNPSSPSPHHFHSLPHSSSRGSMILYRVADPSSSHPGTPHIGPSALQQSHTGDSSGSLAPPHAMFAGGSKRGSMHSISGDSMLSMTDSRYRGGAVGGLNGNGELAHLGRVGAERGGGSVGLGVGYGPGGGGAVGVPVGGLVAYAYDPDEDDDTDNEDVEGDWLHDPEVGYPGESTKGLKSSMRSTASTQRTSDASSMGTRKGKDVPPIGAGEKGKGKAPGKQYKEGPGSAMSWRGFINIGTLVAMVAALLCLFVVYPMIRAYSDEGINARITGNLRINSTGQAITDEEYDALSGGKGAPRSRSSAAPTSTRVLNQQGVIERRAWRRQQEAYEAQAWDVPSLPTATATPDVSMFKATHGSPSQPRFWKASSNAESEWDVLDRAPEGEMVEVEVEVEVDGEESTRVKAMYVDNSWHVHPHALAFLESIAPPSAADSIPQPPYAFLFNPAALEGPYPEVGSAHITEGGSAWEWECTGHCSPRTSPRKGCHGRTKDRTQGQKPVRDVVLRRVRTYTPLVGDAYPELRDGKAVLRLDGEGMAW